MSNPVVGDSTALEVGLENVRPRPDLQGGVFGHLLGAIGNPQSAIALATLPLDGTVRLCFVSTGCTGPSIAYPLGTQTGSGFVGAGVGGLLTIVPTPALSARISVFGAPWTLHTATIFQRSGFGPVRSVTRMGFAHGPASMTGSTTLTSGTLSLVTATQIESTLLLPTHRRSGTFQRLSVRFVPEPSQGALWLASALALAGVRRRSTRRRTSRRA